MCVCNTFSLNLVVGGSCREGPWLELDIDDGPGSGILSDKATLLKMASWRFHVSAPPMLFPCHQMPSATFPFVFTCSRHCSQDYLHACLITFLEFSHGPRMSNKHCNPRPAFLPCQILLTYYGSGC